MKYVPRRKLKSTIKVFQEVQKQCTLILRRAPFGVTLCFFMLKQQHDTLKKVEQVKKHNKTPLKSKVFLLSHTHFRIKMWVRGSQLRVKALE